MARKREIVLNTPTMVETQRRDLISNTMKQHDSSHRDSLMRSNTILVSAQLTEICVAHNKRPEEVVEIYSQVYELLQDWYAGKPVKEQIKMMLDTLLPTETLEARGYIEKK
ncbi:MAG: hypothetical protein SVY53_01535 [Chloroflexota bacterium]|nr:hypothetical protein [Chloroflexota bacterium]